MQFALRNPILYAVHSVQQAPCTRFTVDCCVGHAVRATQPFPTCGLLLTAMPHTSFVPGSCVPHMILILQLCLARGSRSAAGYLALSLCPAAAILHGVRVLQPESHMSPAPSNSVLRSVAAQLALTLGSHP